MRERSYWTAVGRSAPSAGAHTAARLACGHEAGSASVSAAHAASSLTTLNGRRFHPWNRRGQLARLCRGVYGIELKVEYWGKATLAGGQRHLSGRISPSCDARLSA